MYMLKQSTLISDQFIPSLSDICLAEEKRIFKEIKHLQYDLKILTQ